MQNLVVNIGWPSKQMVDTLSGGKQQLAIARSLISNPKMILFDEPSLGLSPILVEQVKNFVIDFDINP